MYFLAIETSCDETAASVFTEGTPETGPVVLSNVVASQLREHERYQGVVPEIAARAHLKQLLPVIDAALLEAKITLQQLNAIAVMNTPGLVGALLVGVSAAKALAFALNLPLYTLNHIEAHIYACRLAAKKEIFPCIGLVVSGGHTTLFHCKTALEFQPIGGTIDDAAGEAFDKVAAQLGLGFPGGPAVSKLAVKGNPQAFKFPRSFLHEERLDFSFSGLKTAVRYCIRDWLAEGRELDEATKANIAASFEAAVVEVLVAKSHQAMKKFGLNRLAIGGGVSANGALRKAMTSLAEKKKLEVIIPPLEYCTDNAAMACLAVEKWRIGDVAGLDVDATPVYQPAKEKRTI